MKIRINKYLALCGIGSRRKVEELISDGAIRIHGQVVTDLSYRWDEENDTVLYKNKTVSPLGNRYYIILNKPKGYITTLNDEKGRPTVMDIIPEKYRRAGVFPVGRLDKDTEGLLLLTNDGELAHILSSPGSGIEKEYQVELDRPLDEKDMVKIEGGVFIHQIMIKTKKARIVPHPVSPTHYTMTISEGKKRQIRYVFKNFGYTVKKLKRTAYGPLSLKGINRGELRELKNTEIKRLQEAAEGFRERK
jgi:pseudouridine synthase